MIGMTETLPAECRDSVEAVDKRHRSTGVCSDQ